MTFACGNPGGFWNRAVLVTPGPLAVVSMVVVLLLAASIISVGLDAFGRKSLAGEPAGRRTALFAALWLGVLFSITLAAKLLLMREVSVTAPFWDQWDGEGRLLFIPFQHCTLSWPPLFSLHNEHRMFFSRLLALDLLALNGQWDPRLEQVVNALIHSITAVVVAKMFWRGGRWRQLPTPCSSAWRRSRYQRDGRTRPDQSALSLLFGVLALWLMTSHRPGQPRWPAGRRSVGSSPAGGFLAAVASRW
jgi:hypothetical protein